MIHQEIIWFYGILNSSRYSYFWLNHFPVTTGCHDDSFKGNEARVVSIGFRQFTYSSNDLSSSKCSSTFLKVPVAPYLVFVCFFFLFFFLFLNEIHGSVYTNTPKVVFQPPWDCYQCLQYLLLPPQHLSSLRLHRSSFFLPFPFASNWPSWVVIIIVLLFLLLVVVVVLMSLFLRNLKKANESSISFIDYHCKVSRAMVFF